MKSDVKSRQSSVARETFLANRVATRVELAVDAEGGTTRRRHVSESGSLRLRFPNRDGRALEAVVVNTAGGIAGGDRHTFDILVADNADLIVTTAAAEKVYRTLGPESVIDARFNLAARARLSWLPQETIAFDDSRLQRTIDVDLSHGAALTLAEMVVFGRSAMGERVRRGSFVDRWRVRRDGKLLFAESMRLDGPVADKLAEPAVANGGAAIATLLIVPGNDATAENVRALKDRFSGEVGISAWNGFALARVCAPDGAALRSDLALVLSAIGTPLPRLWLN